MQSINNVIMRTKCIIDMKQTIFKREFHNLPLYALRVVSPNFKFCDFRIGQNTTPNTQ